MSAGSRPQASQMFTNENGQSVSSLRNQVRRLPEAREADAAQRAGVAQVGVDRVLEDREHEAALGLP